MRAVGAKFGDGIKAGIAKHLQKILAHGVVGGMASRATGGKFGDGFRSAATAQAFAPMIDGIGGKYGSDQWAQSSARAQRIAMAAIVGGTTAAMTGGKFANGAVTAAFSRAFNDEATVAKLKDEARLFGQDVMNGVVRDRIVQFGKGVADGTASMGEGLVNFAKQQFRRVSSDPNTQQQVSLESRGINESVNAYMTDASVRESVNSALRVEVSNLDNYTPYNIGRFVGRIEASIVLRPLGPVGAWGNVLSGADPGATSFEELLRSGAIGH